MTEERKRIDVGVDTTSRNKFSKKKHEKIKMQQKDLNNIAQKASAFDSNYCIGKPTRDNHETGMEEISSKV